MAIRSCAHRWQGRVTRRFCRAWLIRSISKSILRDVHFDLAAEVRESGAECVALEAQIAAQHPSAPDCAGSRDESDVPCLVGVSHTGAHERDGAQSEEMGDTGLEPVTSRV